MGHGSVTEVHALSPVDWQVLRDLRLRALQDAPYAFTSSYERELAFVETNWRDRVRTGHWFVASDDGKLVGIAGGVEGWSGDPSKRELIGMWVAESHRSRGVALTLLEHVSEWARSEGASTLRLGVVEGNDRARRAYEKMGLHATGRTEGIWNDATWSVETMEMDLGAR